MNQKTKDTPATPATKNATPPVATNAAERGTGPEKASQKTTTPTAMSLRRRTLAALSAELKAKNPNTSTNSLLLAFYSAQLGCNEFDTFDGWKARGRAVRRGEKAVTIWRKSEDEGKSGWLVQFLFGKSQTIDAPAVVMPAQA